MNHQFPIFTNGHDPIQEWINKKNIEKCKKNIEINTLSKIQYKSIDDLISNYTVAELKVHAKHINLKGVSKLNKAELAKVIFEKS